MSTYASSHPSTDDDTVSSKPLPGTAAAGTKQYITELELTIIGKTNHLTNTIKAR